MRSACRRPAAASSGSSCWRSPRSWPASAPRNSCGTCCGRGLRCRRWCWGTITGSGGGGAGPSRWGDSAAGAAGAPAPAARWLGRRYSLRAAVERGAGRGRTIGVPTINLTPPDPRKLLPPDGVYAVRVEIPGQRATGNVQRYGGMMNQGPRPTFGVQARGLEIHLFDFSGDLYRQVVTVEWVRRLRDVQTFPSRQALVDQIERDAVAARAILNP